jgi:cytochrome c553
MLERLFRIAALTTGGLLAARRLLFAPPPVRNPSSTAAAQTNTQPADIQTATSAGTNWWRTGLKLAALGLALGLLGLLAAASGLIPIKASSGHWAITNWLLSFSMERSVNTHSLPLEPPSQPGLEDPAMVLKGAGHYETGCRACHGSPELRHPRVTQKMTPPPPYLPPEISEWQARELFYIVKHGVKFTGMPAWPALERDDEVWAMVAFLRHLPRLDASGYRQLVHGPVANQPAAVAAIAPMQEMSVPATGPTDALAQLAAENCARCHGLDGLGRGTGAFPNLAGQRPAYLAAALQAYTNSTRPSGLMEPVAAGLSAESLRALAGYYAQLPRLTATPARHANDAAALTRGAAIAQQGLPQQRLPACAACHGPGEQARQPHYPVLAGQPANYLVLQLELFNTRVRRGSEYAHLMHPIAARLSPAQMRDVALYYEQLR